MYSLAHVNRFNNRRHRKNPKSCNYQSSL